MGSDLEILQLINSTLVFITPRPVNRLERVPVGIFAAWTPLRFGANSLPERRSASGVFRLRVSSLGVGTMQYD